MSELKKYSLIIQGPILSIGMAGDTYLKYFAENDKKYVIKYNCVENIRRILIRYSALFQEVIVSTWENEEITEADVALCANCRLIKSKDITPIYKNDRQPNGQMGLLKQFYSIQMGMMALSDNSPDHYIVKIRTDQFVDLEKMLDEHSKADEKSRNGKIYIPYFALNTVGDFYFVATRINMENFCKAIMRCVDIPQVNIGKTTVHIVMPYAYYIFLSKANPKNEPGIFLKSLYPDFERLDTTIINCREAKKMVDFIYEHFKAFSKDVLYNAEWRGARISHNERFMFSVNRKFNAHCPKLSAGNMFLYLSSQTYFSQKGRRNLKSIIALLNFILLDKLSFYRRCYLKKYKTKIIVS